MTNAMKTLLGSVAVAAFLTPTAIADESNIPDGITIDQVELGDVWANIDVRVNNSSSDLVGTSAAIANSANGVIQNGPIDADIDQRVRGNVDANTFIWAGDVADRTIASTSATGNAASAGNWFGDTNVDVDQSIKGNVTAQSRVDVQWTNAISAQTQAVGNVSEVDADFTAAHVNTEQDLHGSVFSASVVDARQVDDFVQNTAIAAGNSSSVFLGDADAWTTTRQSTASGETIVSSAITEVDYVGETFTTSAAVGNQLEIATVDVASDHTISQANGAGVFASADTFVDSFGGFATVSANGVGNSANVSTLRGSTQVDNSQINRGNVGSDVVFDASSFSGGTGVATSTAFGNNFSAISQDGGIGGVSSQRNIGNVSASTQFRSNQIGQVSASSVAIGNAATFSTNASGSVPRGD